MTIRDYAESKDILIHHGVKGMKWGIRRYQNADGTLTEAGKRREAKKIRKDTIKKYNYKTSDKYMNADKSVKRKITARHIGGLFAGGPKVAKNIDYRVLEEGDSYSKAYIHEGSKAVGNILASLGYGIGIAYASRKIQNKIIWHQ